MRVKNWEKYQHYKDRRPPWIKLYHDLLDDKEWFDLDPLAAKLLINLWLLASEQDGCLPDIPVIAFRLRLQEKAVSNGIQKLSHWLLQDNSTLLADCKQVATSETETETETETYKEETETDAFELFWNVYPKKVGRKDALKAWNKAKDKPQVVDIIQAIDNAKNSEQWKKENGQFIPNPSTWLNQGRWADEVQPAMTNGKASHAPIPPFPGPEDPIARGQWRKAYGDPANPRRVG